MILLDLFSGIHGFAKGLEDAGLPSKEHYFSEVDKHAIAVSKHNYPNAYELGSILTVSGRDIPRPDIITFGSPCQDFSVAGEGAGMAGRRSVLIRQAIRLITETRPTVFIWENVKNVITKAHRADFWAILQAFANIGGYRLEWQLMDTEWLLPQSRERIYVVGHLTGRSEPGVFPVRDSDFPNTRKQEPTKAPIVNCITAGGKSGGHHSGMTLVRQINPNRESGGVQPYQQNRVYDIDGISPCLSAETEGRPPIIITRSRGFNKGGESTKVGTLSSSSFEHNHHVFENGRYRRLTEIECERLQGFPDDWTKWGIYAGIKKKVPKTQRYKMIGNAVTEDMVELIGKRLKSCLQP